MYLEKYCGPSLGKDRLPVDFHREGYIIRESGIKRDLFSLFRVIEKLQVVSR